MTVQVKQWLDQNDYGARISLRCASVISWLSESRFYDTALPLASSYKTLYDAPRLRNSIERVEASNVDHLGGFMECCALNAREESVYAYLVRPPYLHVPLD